jgi:hypothetical protein
MAIWKWAKDNAIDQGLPFEKVHDAINAHFFGGQAKPQWINDILAGRKTPFRQVADNVWKARAQRREIVQQAKAAYQDYNTHPAMRWLRHALEFPRALETMFHAAVFPVTHGGDLAYRPESWRTLYDGWIKTWQSVLSKAEAERLADSMERDPSYRMAREGGLDFGGSHGIMPSPGGVEKLWPTDPRRLMRWSNEQSARAWQGLTYLRFQLWKQQFEHYANPATMNHEQMMDYAVNLADWANHATGSVKMHIPLGGELMFGPKLTASKIARLVSDPIKTLNTIVKGQNATPGERAVALTRIHGAAQYVATRIGFLVANGALLQVLGSKQQVNLTDPTQSDFMKFKGLGLEGSLGGMDSETHAMAKFLAYTFMSEKALKAGVYPYRGSKGEYLWSVPLQYVRGKASPTIQRVIEFASGEDWQGRPLPWNPDPGTAKKPRLSWGEYAGSIGPIPLSGAIKSVYDGMRKRGASPSEASSIIKALIIAGLGSLGVHAQDEYENQGRIPMRARNERAQLAR